MPFIDTTAPRDAKGEVHDMYARQQSHWGFVPNYAKVFSHRPEVLARWGRLLAEIRRPMDARRFELITFAAAHALRHSGCTLAHGEALTAYIDERDVMALTYDEACEAVSEAERAMMNFSRKIATDAVKVTSGDVDLLRKQGFSEEEIFDIAATAAGRAFFTKLLDGLGVEPDVKAMELDETFRKALTVGRHIDFRDPEVLSPM